MNKNEILFFLKKPVVVVSQKKTSFKESLLISVKVFAYLLLFSIISGIVIQAPLKLMELSPQHKIIDPTSQNIILVILIAPIIEEIIFRGVLVFNKYFLLVSPTLLIFLLLKKYINIEIGIITIVFTSSIFIFLLFTRRIRNILKNYYLQFFKYLFYFSTLVFGLFHIFNFQDLNTIQLLISPLFVVNQIFMGLLLGYVRVNYRHGLYICIISHILLNSLFAIHLFF